MTYGSTTNNRGSNHFSHYSRLNHSPKEWLYLKKGRNEILKNEVILGGSTVYGFLFAGERFDKSRCFHLA